MKSTAKRGLAFLLDARNGPVPGIICSLCTVAILMVGLWPFELNPVNKVEWVQNGEGIRFYGQGMILSRGPMVVQGTASGNASVTIELLARPHKEISTLVASMLTLYDGQREQFIFGQWKKELIIRVPALKADNHKRYREIDVQNILNKDTTHLITVISNRETTAIYIDGKPAKRSRLFSLIPKDQRLSGQLVLGNSPEGTNPWNGTFLGVAIYDDMLTSQEIRDHFHAWQKHGQPLVSNEHAGSQSDKPTSPRAAKPVALYLFDEHNNDKIRDQARAHNDLLIPAAFKPLRTMILGMPERDQWFSRANLKDVAINILGFAPFGFFLSAWLRRVKNLPAPRVYGITLLIGACLSLAIELIQVYLPARDSSLMDVFSNILGTALGVFIFKYGFPVFHKVKGDSQLII
jgi:VanZ family protein